MTPPSPRSADPVDAAPRRARWLPLVVGLAVACLSLLFWRLLVVQELAHVKAQFEQDAEVLAVGLADHLEQVNRALRRMAGRWTVGGGFQEAEWTVDAQAYVRDIAGLEALAWMGPDGDVRRMVRDVDGAGAPASDLRAIVQEQAPDPVGAGQPSDADGVVRIHGAGVLKYLPLRPDGLPGGHLVAVLQPAALVAKALPTAGRRRFRIELRTGAERYALTEPAGRAAADWEARHPIHLPGPDWQLVLAPSAKYLRERRSVLHDIVLAGGLFMSLVLAWMVALNQKLRSRQAALSTTRHELESKVAELRSSNESVTRANEESDRVNEVMLGLLEDLQEERDRAKTALQAEQTSRERTELILASTAEALYGVDQAGRCTFCNPACAEMLGLDGPADLQGERVSDFIEIEGAGESGPCGADMLAPARTGERARGEGVLRRRDGTTVPVEYWSYPVSRQGKLVGAVASFVDISDRVRARDALRQLNEELEQRVEQRTAELRVVNRELESFSYSVSHDLRAPLRHVSGFIDLLREQFGNDLDEEGRRYLQIIEEAAEKMGRLIDDLLAFSRSGRVELRYERVALGELLEEVREELAPESEGRKVAWRVGTLPEVEADRSMLRLVLMNLVSNALKYTRQEATAEITIDSRLEGERHVIQVRDNGVGFDEQYAGKLFGVFQRLHANSEFEGVGIGLANVRRIVERHGGEVRASAALGEGAMFCFTLPASSLHRGEEDIS